MRIQDIADTIERFAPLSLQESYDNSGLIVGRYEQEVHHALLAVDVTEEVLDEAERYGCDIVITHHPIIFHAMKRFNSATYVERCVERAIRSGIALYACHTNLDSASHGMSRHLAEQIGLSGISVLQPFGRLRRRGRACRGGGCRRLPATHKGDIRGGCHTPQRHNARPPHTSRGRMYGRRRLAHWRCSRLAGRPLSDVRSAI